jgi:hypothetical protein
LLDLLPDRWFNDYDLWVKPLYAVKNHALDGIIDLDDALFTLNEIFMKRSDHYNRDELLRVFNLDIKASDKRITLGTIIKAVRDINPEGYAEYKVKYCSTSKSDDRLTTVQILKKAMLEKTIDGFYKRHTGVVYEQYLPYYYTPKFTKPIDFLNHLLGNNEVLTEVSKKRDRDELIDFICNVNHDSFKYIKIDHNYIGFNNGVYDLSIGRFLPGDDVPKNIQVRRMIDNDFVDCETPLYDKYLSYQFTEQDDIDYIHFLLGRTLTRLNDNFDFMLMINGVSNTGKSTIAKIALHSMYKSDIGILSKSLESKFGICDFANKQIVYCDDMPYNLPKVLDRGDFLAMMWFDQLSCKR